MNIEELKKALDEEGVKPIYYSLNGIREVQEVGAAIGAHILEKKGKKWMCYFYERRGKFDVKYFDTEDEACKYMLEQLTSDPTTRIYGPEQAAKNEILLRVVRAQDGTEAQAFLDKQVEEGKMTSEQSAEHMVLWNKVHLKQT